MNEQTKQTWTFFGHWENDRLVVEYSIPGEHEDLRRDYGYWEQGLWADSGTGATEDEARTEIVGQYEDDLHAGDDED